MINLSELTRAELEKLKNDIEVAIVNLERAEKSEAILLIEGLAAERGFTLAELIGKKSKTVKNRAKPKYRNPSNPAEVWSGKGRQPDWFKREVASGTNIEDLSI